MRNKNTEEKLDQDELDRLLKEEAEKAVHHKIKDLVRQKGTFKERSGSRLALVLLMLIGLITVMLLCYKFFGNAETDEVIQLARVFITNTLLPVLTLILGYIFGSREDLSRNQ